MRRAMIVEGICGLFILLFIYTAITKLVDFNSFKATLQQSPLIAAQGVVVAWLLPTAELTIAVLLFLPATKKVGLYGSLVIMILFTAYIGYMILFAIKLPCSCGGVISRLSWRQHLVFNIVWIVLAIIALQLFTKQGVSRKPDPE